MNDQRRPNKCNNKMLERSCWKKESL